MGRKEKGDKGKIIKKSKQRGGEGGKERIERGETKVEEGIGKEQRDTPKKTLKKSLNAI